MQRRKFLTPLGILLILFHQTLTAQTTDSSYSGSIVYSLQQCIDSAVKNNPTVKTSSFTSQAAKATLDQQKGTMLPYVSGYASFINNGGRSINSYTNGYTNENYNSTYYQLQATMTLWNGGSIQNFIRQYSLNYQATQMDYQQAKDQMTVSVILAYINVLSTQEQLNMARAQVEATRGKVRLLQIQNNEGSITPSALSDMKGQLGADELTLVNTQNSLESYKLALAQYMNIPYSPNLRFVDLGQDLSPKMYDATVDQIYQNATQNLAQVKAANLHLASANKAVKATRGNMFPTLSLYGQVYTLTSSAASASSKINTTIVQTESYVNVNGAQIPVYSPHDNYTPVEPISFSDQFKNNVYTQVGLQLSIPILAGYQKRTLYRQAKINLDQARFNATTTLTTLRQAVESYYVTMANDFRIYNTLDQQVKDYEESFRAAEIRFNVGAVTALTSLDYLTAKNNIDRAKLNLIQAKYNYILQTKVLDYFQGKLTW